MAGRGRAPKLPEERRRANVPTRGEWVATPGVGWQHGPLPTAPERLLKQSRETWDTWMTSWFAAHWGPQDLPMLRQIIRLFDRIERGDQPGMLPAKAQDRTELRLLSESYGITPKGQQDRHWLPPKDETPEAPADTGAQTKKPGGRYAHLRSVG